MRILMSFSILILFSLQTFASNVTTIPELKVLSKSGLKLRLSPDLDSPVLDVLEYGETVKLVEDSLYTPKVLQLNWVNGQWLKVNFNNQIGYVFDGFLSSLEVPTSISELSPDLDGLSYAIYNWAYNNYDLIQTDTLANTDVTISTLTQLGDHQLFMLENEGSFIIEISLTGVRIMDAYHLLESMMDDRSGRSMLKENSMFFRDRSGALSKIKIGQEVVKIQSFEDGSVKIKIKTQRDSC